MSVRGVRYVCHKAIALLVLRLTQSCQISGRNDQNESRILYLLLPRCPGTCGFATAFSFASRAGAVEVVVRAKILLSCLKVQDLTSVSLVGSVIDEILEQSRGKSASNPGR